jgi:hypothetical protein
MKYTLRFIVAINLLFVTPGSVQAATVTIGASADTGLLETPGDSNLGGSTGPIVGTTSISGISGRMLLRFEITNAVPAGSVINSVTLQLVDVSSPMGTLSASNFELHRMLVSWVEGNKGGSGGNRNGATATAGESTWLYRNYNTNFWTGGFGGGAGSDYATTISGTKLINVAGQTNTWNNTPALMSDVQLWLDDPGSNFGWMLLSDGQGNGGTARRFGTRESTDPLERPLLTIDFSAVPEPTTVALLGLAGAAWIFRRLRR